VIEIVSVLKSRHIVTCSLKVVFVGLVGDTPEINKFAAAKKYTLILSLIYMSKVKARDNLVEMFLKCIRNIQNNGKDELKKIQEKNRAKTENLISILTNVLVKTNDNNKNDAILGKLIREIVNENGGTEVLLTDCDTISSYNGNNYLP